MLKNLIPQASSSSVRELAADITCKRKLCILHSKVHFRRFYFFPYDVTQTFYFDQNPALSYPSLLMVCGILWALSLKINKIFCRTSVEKIYHLQIFLAKCRYLVHLFNHDVDGFHNLKNIYAENRGSHCEIDFIYCLKTTHIVPRYSMLLTNL